MSNEDLRAAAEAGREAMVEFARRLIQTPSLSGQEGAVAALIEAELRALGYDEVWRDEAGNVIGLLRATAPAGSSRPKRIMFNTHMDQVDVGDPARWPYPPFAATIADGAIWGRGASDLKGPMACQIHAIAALKRLGRPLPNDCYISTVVQEEVGGVGARTLVKTVHTDYCILGEPTANRLMRGHRGRVLVRVTFRGRSVHASVPDEGRNPLYSLARFLQGLEVLPMVSDPAHPDLGASSVAPTLLYTDQTSSNVIPAEVVLYLDWRNVPADVPDDIIARVQSIAEHSVQEGVSVVVEPDPLVLTSYTGLQMNIGGVSLSFGTPADAPLVVDAQRILGDLYGRAMPVGLWRFATDGGYFAETGTSCIGFSPGWEEVIHTVDERISIELMVEAFAGYMALALGL